MRPAHYISTVLKRNPFIIPSAPVLKREPPNGAQWIHEVKFDGWRGQLHKAGDDVTIFSRNGKDLTLQARTREAPVKLLLSGSIGP